MYIHGTYRNQQDEQIEVLLLTKGDRSQEVEIGSEDSGLYFTDDPVELTTQVNDTLDHLLPEQASVRLLTRNYMGAQLFSTTCRDAVVNIYREGECLFAGYVEPQAFSQPYNEELDELELTCIDALGALQYANYAHVGSLGVSYQAVRAKARTRSIADIVGEIMGDATQGLDIKAGKPLPIRYDGSKALDPGEASRYTLPSQTALSELLFLGSEESDTWTQEEVMGEILQYLGLRMMQQGLCLYLFDWHTLRAGKPTQWADMTGSQPPITTQPRTIDISSQNVTDCEAKLTTLKAYNLVRLTCQTQATEDLMDSPLDSDKLETTGQGKQLYITEYAADGEGYSAWMGMYDMMRNEGATTYDAATITDWWAQPKTHPGWTFYQPGEKDIMDLFRAKGQNMALDTMGQLTGAAMLLSLGKAKRYGDGRDNSPTATVGMTDTLYISINGNGKDSPSETHPSEQELRAAIPMARYTGNTAGGSLSPADPMVTNYIVIKGKVVMNPLMPMTEYYTPLRYAMEDYSTTGVMKNPPYWHQTVEKRDGGVRYYTRRHWRQAMDLSLETNPGPDLQKNPGLVPYTQEGPQLYPYRGTTMAGQKDQLSKVPLLALMIRVGDKCVREKKKGELLGTDTPGTGRGEPQDFVWTPYKSREQCQSDEEYYSQSLTIGIDPKPGDKLIGTEYSLQNNVSLDMGLDTEGTAIPIGYADRVGGQVEITLLGPLNNTLDEDQVTIPEVSFWHAIFSIVSGKASVPLLAHTSSLQITDLEIKVTTDGGKVDLGKRQSDLVYQSDTQETYRNPKDDLKNRICSALTAEESRQLGIGCSVWLSTPTNLATGAPLTTLYSHPDAAQAKPEQLYVSDCYEEWHLPRVELEQSMADTAREGLVSPLNLYRHPYLGKTFHVEGISRNLTEGTATLKLKEVF